MGERPGVTERIGQPKDGCFSPTEVFAKIASPQQELPHQRFGPDHVTIGFDPHAAGYFPTALCHPRPDLLENVRVVLGDVLVDLGLTLGEVKVGELLHQPQDAAEGAHCLVPGLADGP